MLRTTKTSDELANEEDSLHSDHDEHAQERHLHASLHT